MDGILMGRHVCIPFGGDFSARSVLALTREATPADHPRQPGRLRRKERTRPLSSRQEQLSPTKKPTVAARSWRYDTSNELSSGICVEEWPLFAASPEIDEDNDACDRRISAPHRGERVRLDCINNQKNHQVYRPKNHQDPDLREEKRTASRNDIQD